jgi:hypothetical protein
MVVKKASMEKKTTNKKVNKEDSLECEVCGLSVVVKEVGGLAVVEETVLLCWGKPLKKKVNKTKSVKK